MNAFKIYSPKSIEKYLNERPGETKLGERISFLSEPDLDRISDSEARFVLFGIPEDIGVRANRGIGGTSQSWEPFLKAFVNVQSNRFLIGDEILLAGAFDFSHLLEKTGDDTDLEKLREYTAEIDVHVTDLVKRIVKAGKIPVAVGGGHNNCYGMIKGCSEALDRPLNVVNCDPHSDFRSAEGRHSGNGFRYAMEEGKLNFYAVVGLHEGYNSEENLKSLDLHNVKTHYSLFEDIFVRGKLDWKRALADALEHTGTENTGIELDMDCIAFAPVSAMTPSGITPEHARQYVSYFGRKTEARYLHVCEAAPFNAHLPPALTGKLLSYIIADFIKAAR